LLDRESGADVSVDIGDIIAITIVKKSKLKSGIVLGFLIGGIIGALAPSPEATEARKASESLVAGPKAVGAALEKPLKSVEMIVIFGSIGMIVGGSMGAAAGTDKAIQAEGKSETEIKEILEKLRKKARVRNIQ
jgi:hypothetical protein